MEETEAAFKNRKNPFTHTLQTQHSLISSYKKRNTTYQKGKMCNRGKLVVV